MPVKVQHENLGLEAASYLAPSATKTSDGAYSPIGPAGARLVDALARAGWDVPGLDVEITTIGSGREVHRGVRKISGVTEAGPFELSFTNCARYGSRGAYSLLTNATVPPGLEIQYYSDRSGPVAHVYVGSDYKAEGLDWIASFKHHEKLDGKERRTLKYTGSFAPRGQLKFDNDIGRAHGRDDDPRTLSAPRVAADVSAFIETLTTALNARPAAPGHDDVTAEGDANFRRLTVETPQPAPADFPVLYTWIRRSDAFVAVGRGEDTPDKQRIVPGNGKRLVPLGHGVSADPSVHPEVTSGFSYLSADPKNQAPHPGDYPNDDILPVVVQLKHLNHVFVADAAAYHAARAASAEAADKEGRDEYTNDEIRHHLLELARSMVPAADYRGGYRQPFYAVNRQLHEDEARVARGMIHLDREDDVVAASLTDRQSGVTFPLLKGPSLGARAIRRTLERALDLGELIDEVPQLSQEIRQIYNAKLAEEQEAAPPAFAM